MIPGTEKGISRFSNAPYLRKTYDMEKPKKKDYGYIASEGFDSEPSGWAFEGGEEKYFDALKKWEEVQEL